MITTHLLLLPLVAYTTSDSRVCYSTSSRCTHDLSRCMPCTRCTRMPLPCSPSAHLHLLPDLLSTSSRSPSPAGGRRRHRARRHLRCASRRDPRLTYNVLSGHCSLVHPTHARSCPSTTFFPSGAARDVGLARAPLAVAARSLQASHRHKDERCFRRPRRRGGSTSRGRPRRTPADRARAPRHSRHAPMHVPLTPLGLRRGTWDMGQRSQVPVGPKTRAHEGRPASYPACGMCVGLGSSPGQS